MADRFVPLVVFVAISCLGGCGPAPMTTPKTFTLYNSPDGTFACEHPDGWEAAGNAKRQVIWAKFTSGDAKIDVRATASGSLLADAMGGRHADPELPMELHPVHLVHEDGIGAFQADLPNYKELPGSPIELDCALGPARLSEFTATTSFGAAMHGYRVTVLGHKKGVNVTCLCREGDWQALKPAFDHALSTLRRGET